MRIPYLQKKKKKKKKKKKDREFKEMPKHTCNLCTT